MKILLFSILAVGMLLLAGCTQKAPNIPDETKNATKNDSSGSKFAKEGEFCGGIAAFQCAKGLECKYDGSYPDAGGKCVKIGTQMANPASVNCVKMGGTLRIVKEEGKVYGMCTLANGTECEEWDFFRTGKCIMTLEKADAYNAAQQYAKLTPTYKYDGSGLASVKNETLGGGKYRFTFSYESSHGGYGDRTGMIVTQAITPHTLVIGIEGNRVMSATADGTNDEMAALSPPDGGRTMPMTQQLCENGGGRWNECASACRNDPDAEVCTLQCVQVCECNIFSLSPGLTCPNGWACKGENPSISNQLGQCAPAENA